MGAEPPGRPSRGPAARYRSGFEPLGIEQALLLDGRPFPPRKRTSSPLPDPRRTFFVSAAAAAAGEGTEARPWGDVQAALRALSPGDRLVFLPGSYAGPIRVDAACRNGTSKSVIQVVFRKAKITAGGGEPAFSIARRHWRLDGVFIAGNEKEKSPLVELGPGADHVWLEGARLDAWSGSGLVIGGGARHVVLAHSKIGSRSREERPISSSAGVDVRPGAGDVRLIEDWIVGSAGAGVRIGASSSEEAGSPERIAIVGSTLRDCGGPAVWVFGVSGLHIADTDLFQSRPDRVGLGEGVRLEGGRGIHIERDRFRDFGLAVRVGVSDSKAGRGRTGPSEVIVERSCFESRTGKGSAIAIETAAGVRVSNNVLDGLADAFLVFGRPPATEKISVVNNLVLRLAETAFRLDDPSCASFFDANIFAPRSGKAFVENGGARFELSEFLARGTMPATRVGRNVRFMNRDLARVRGVETVDRGRALDGIKFAGSAPDIGIAEH